MTQINFIILTVGQVWAIGGYNGLSRLSTCESYSPQMFFWAPAHDMISPRSNFGIEVIDDSIMVTGGFDGVSTINKVEYYRAENNAWYEKTHFDIIHRPK